MYPKARKPNNNRSLLQHEFGCRVHGIFRLDPARYLAESWCDRAQNKKIFFFLFRPKSFRFWIIQNSKVVRLFVWFRRNPNLKFRNYLIWRRHSSLAKAKLLQEFYRLLLLVWKSLALILFLYTIPLISCFLLLLS